MARIRTFNSRPHKEADRFLNPDGRSGVLSTHGLTRRPTGYSNKETEQTYLSTHGLTRRPTRGRDDHSNSRRALSTHGLTRRPTKTSRQSGWNYRPFNSRPHKEADMLDGFWVWKPISFNSRPHKEADADPPYLHGTRKLSTHGLTRRPTRHEDDTILLSNLSTHGLTRRPTARDQTADSVMESFNSRPHKEADHYEDTLDRHSGLSTHGLTRRPTNDQRNADVLSESFNSRPHKEADRIVRKTSFEIISFNSRPHKEADSASHRKHLPDSVFQLTASQGGRLVLISILRTK